MSERVTEEGIRKKCCQLVLGTRIPGCMQKVSDHPAPGHRFSGRRVFQMSLTRLMPIAVQSVADMIISSKRIGDFLMSPEATVVANDDDARASGVANGSATADSAIANGTTTAGSAIANGSTNGGSTNANGSATGGGAVAGATAARKPRTAAMHFQSKRTLTQISDAAASLASPMLDPHCAVVVANLECSWGHGGGAAAGLDMVKVPVKGRRGGFGLRPLLSQSWY